MHGIVNIVIGPLGIGSFFDARPRPLPTVATSPPTQSEIAISENKAPRSREKVDFQQRADLPSQGIGCEGKAILFS